MCTVRQKEGGGRKGCSAAEVALLRISRLLESSGSSTALKSPATMTCCVETTRRIGRRKKGERDNKKDREKERGMESETTRRHTAH